MSEAFGRKTKRMKTNHSFVQVIRPLAGSICALIAVASFLPLQRPAFAAEAKKRAARPSVAPPEQVAAVNPRSPEETLRAGLDYLLKQQQPDGGWPQGGGWRQNLQQTGGRVESGAEDPSDLGNTCVALVALIRAGHTPKAGEHRDAAAKAFEFICRMIEKADTESLYVTPVRDTQLQVKIGSYVDTFLAGWALSELKDRLPDDASETRRAAAVDKVVAKIERHQGSDGAFTGNNGWASVLSQGLASKALNSAARSGAKVSQSALEKDAVQNNSGLDRKTGDFTAPTAAAEPSSAGVSLYRETAKLGGLWEKTKSNAKAKKEAEKTMADAAAPAPAKQQAEEKLRKIDDEEKAARQAAGAIAAKAQGDTRYTAGFGNNGGEEYLSFMNLTESLHAQGGKEWSDWRPKMQKTICSTQNADGSWAGHHCITGRTFCTSAALLTLLVDKQDDPARTTSVETTENQTTAAK